jgi:thiamine-monophosphate kinase
MAGTRRPGEFEAIARWLAPLARHAPESLGLLDDAAVLSPTPGRALVLTVDTIVGGVHFLADDPPGDIARKLLRVNLSDLAAMAAEPRWCLLAMSLGEAQDETWLEAFAEGLGADLESFGVALIGGDTTATPGPLTLSLTALGEVEEGGAVLRSTAAAGQDIWVTGTLGDAALALALMQGRAGGLKPEDFPYLRDRYRVPQPRTALGPRLAGIATAMLDVSDGLAADLGHICAASRIGADVAFESLPLSDEARRVLDACPDMASSVAAGGDDYELLFTAAPGDAARREALGAETGVPVARIGATRAGEGVAVRDPSGSLMALDVGGWRHF